MFVGVQKMPSIKKGRIFIIDLSPRGKNQQFSRGEYSGEEFLRGSFTWRRAVGAREGTCNPLFGRLVNPIPTGVWLCPPHSLLRAPHPDFQTFLRPWRDLLSLCIGWSHLITLSESLNLIVALLVCLVTHSLRSLTTYIQHIFNLYSLF